jgi:hypothetical protein
MFDDLLLEPSDAKLAASPTDAELAAWLAGAARPAWLGEPRQPDRADGRAPVGTRLVELLAMRPAERPTAALAELDATQLSAAGRVDLLELLHQQQNWLEAATMRVLAAIEDADPSEQALSQEVVSLALLVPLRTAQNKLKTAHSLVHELPVTMGLLEQGRISGRHAEAVAEAAWRLPRRVLPALEDRIAEQAPEQTLPRFRQTLRRAAIWLDPATAEERHQRAAADRRVGFQPADDGMVELPVLLPAAQGQSVFTRLTAAARLLPATDPRSMDQKRADLLVEAVLSGLPLDASSLTASSLGASSLTASSSDGRSGRQGHRPSIQVTVSADTLLGLDDDPAELAGYGPITAQAARRLAADRSGTWRRLLTDPDTGQLLDISPHRYRPGQRLKDFVTARDFGCVFPTCNQPGYRCDYEHIQPFGQGGRTCRRNGALACRRHNNCKIGTGWSYQLNPDGSFTWTTATGHRYRGRPPGLPVPSRRQDAAEAGRQPPDRVGADEPPF